MIILPMGLLLSLRSVAIFFLATRPRMFPQIEVPIGPLTRSGWAGNKSLRSARSVTHCLQVAITFFDRTMLECIGRQFKMQGFLISHTFEPSRQKGRCFF